MSREALLAERLTLPPEGLPEAINELTITLQHTPEAISAGVTERVAEQLKFQFKEIRRLFAVGFAAIPGQDGSRFKVKVLTGQGSVTVRVSNAAHRPMLAWLLVRLVESQSQTPPGAFERLVAMIGEEDARDAFDPLDMVRDVEAISVSASGTGPTGHVIDPAQIPECPELDPLVRAIDMEAEMMSFAMPAGARMTEAVENGFLVLQNEGLFRRLAEAFDVEEEPEIWLRRQQGALEMAVEDWTDEPLFLAEFMRVVAGGTIEGITPVDEDQEALVP